MSFFDDIGGALAQVTETVDSLAQTVGGVAGSLAKLKAAGQSLNAKPGYVGQPILYKPGHVQGPPTASEAEGTSTLIVLAGLGLLVFLAVRS